MFSSSFDDDKAQQVHSTTLVHAPRDNGSVSCFGGGTVAIVSSRRRIVGFILSVCSWLLRDSLSFYEENLFLTRLIIMIITMGWWLLLC